MIIAVGANLHGAYGATPLQTCDWAARQIAALPGLSQAVCSRWYSSAPYPPSSQPRYVNGVIRAQTGLPPAGLLRALQGLEQQAGRERSVANAARTLDLDIIDLAGFVHDSPALMLPHPRAHLRDFVLLPLRDVAPDWIHPRLGQSVADLLALLPEGDIHST